MFLVIMVLITHLEKCACVRVNYFYAFRESVRNVASIRPKQAFSGIQLAGNVDHTVDLNDEYYSVH